MNTNLNYFLVVLAMALSVCTISCKKDIVGCMDPTSANYNAEANVDSGECAYNGCTDEQSLNYDAKATIDDGSCTYAREAFIGTFKGFENCTRSGNNLSFSLTISAPSDDVTLVSIYNLGELKLTFDAKVEGNKLTYDNSGTGSNLIVIGTGTLTGDELSLTYTSSNTSSGISEDCSGTGTKQ